MEKLIFQIPRFSSMSTFALSHVGQSDQHALKIFQGQFVPFFVLRLPSSEQVFLSCFM
jgi:hypothetical protein